jgi:hypothetical protein
MLIPGLRKAPRLEKTGHLRLEQALRNVATQGSLLDDLAEDPDPRPTASTEVMQCCVDCSEREELCSQPSIKRIGNGPRRGSTEIDERPQRLGHRNTTPGRHVRRQQVVRTVHSNTTHPRPRTPGSHDLDHVREVTEIPVMCRRPMRHRRIGASSQAGRQQELIAGDWRTPDPVHRREDSGQPSCLGPRENGRIGQVDLRTCNESVLARSDLEKSLLTHRSPFLVTLTSVRPR